MKNDEVSKTRRNKEAKRQYEKDLDYYMALPYRAQALPRYDDGKEYIEVSFPQLPGCVAYGEDYVDAYHNAEKVKKRYLEAALKTNPYCIPEPMEYYIPCGYRDLRSASDIIMEAKRSVLTKVREEMFDDETLKKDVFGLIRCGRYVSRLRLDGLIALQNFLEQEPDENEEGESALVRYYCDRFPLFRTGLWMVGEWIDDAVIAEIFSTQMLMHDNLKDQYIILFMMRIAVLASHYVHEWDVCRALCGMLPEKYLKEALDNKDEILGKDPRLTDEEVKALLAGMTEDVEKEKKTSGKKGKHNTPRGGKKHGIHSHRSGKAGKKTE